MFLIDWIRQYKQMKREFLPEEKPCESCETLRSQLALANQTIDKLMSRILEKPESERTAAPEPTAIRPPILPWAARRQILEREDRARAAALRNAPKSDSELSVPETSVAELEKELGVAEQLRERESSGGGGGA